jgi:allantoinase
VKPSDYGPFDFVPITERPKLTWPNGARLAVWVVTNIEFFPLTHGLAAHPFEAKGTAPTVRPWAQRDYGNRVGIWRIMELFDKLGIRSTATMNAAICDHHPQIVEAALARKWEIAGHCETNTMRLSALDAEQELATIRSSTARLAAATGSRPKGWLGAAMAETWHTIDYLIAEGYEYVADWTNDDQPFMMNIDGRSIVSLPYSYELNDSPFFYYRNGTIDGFEKVIRRQFDVLYEEGATSGRMLVIGLHPFIIGVPHRIRGLGSALSYIKQHDDIWFATGDEIACHYLSQLSA